MIIQDSNAKSLSYKKNKNKNEIINIFWRVLEKSSNKLEMTSQYQNLILKAEDLFSNILALNFIQFLKLLFLITPVKL